MEEMFVIDTLIRPEGSKRLASTLTAFRRLAECRRRRRPKAWRLGPWAGLSTPWRFTATDQ